jgi:outer membrane protein assembly factor BamD
MTGWARTHLAKLRLVAWAMILATAVAAAGCSSTSDAAKKALNPDPPGKMYTDAEKYMNSGAWTSAAKKFEDLDRDHPYSPEARRAMVMAAYAYYKAGKYPEAQAAAQRYTVMHPGTKDAALAHHINASASFDEIKEPHRDQTATRKALQELRTLVQRYPDSPYTKLATNRIRIAEDILAASEMNIGRYYLTRKNYVGAINRFKTVVQEYQTTAHVEEALYRVCEANMTLGVVPEAQSAAAMLGHNFPNSEWYKRSYALLKSGGVSPQMSGDNWFSKTLKALTPGSKQKQEPAAQPKAPGPGQPSPEEMPVPRQPDVPTANSPSGRPPLGFAQNVQ